MEEGIAPRLTQPTSPLILSLKVLIIVTSLLKYPIPCTSGKHKPGLFIKNVDNKKIA